MNKEILERIKQGIAEATKRPTVADAILDPIQAEIFKAIDTKVKPALTRPGDVSGRRFLYVDPRIDISEVE